MITLQFTIKTSDPALVRSNGIVSDIFNNCVINGHITSFDVVSRDYVDENYIIVNEIVYPTMADRETHMTLLNSALDEAGITEEDTIAPGVTIYDYKLLDEDGNITLL